MADNDRANWDFKCPNCGEEWEQTMPYEQEPDEIDWACDCGALADCKVRDEKNPAAVALGRLGGKKGGPARAEKLTAARRQEIAKKAAQVRWEKRRG